MTEFEASVGSNRILGTSGDDVIFGSSGDDNISAVEGDDIITGGAGNDFLGGGSGIDTYIFEVGFGDDRIRDSEEESGESNIIRFGEGITSDDLQFEKQHNDLYISVGDTDGLRLLNFFDRGLMRSTAFSVIEFASGDAFNLLTDITTLGITEGGDEFLGTSEADNITGGTGNDTLFGGSGDDVLDGGDGDDFISGEAGDDLIIGGAGNDRLGGGDGIDTFLFESGFGTDTVSDSDNGNIIRFGAGISLEDLHFEDNTSSAQLLIHVGEDDLIILRDFATSVRGGVRLTDKYSRLEFASGETFDFTTDTLMFSGTDGDDIVDGSPLNDILVGGAGNDLLRGGLGIDTYVFEIGFGIDTIIDDRLRNRYDDRDLSSGNIIQLGEGITFEDLRFERDFLDRLVISVGQEDTIIVSGFFDNNHDNVRRSDIFSHIEFASGEIFDLQTSVLTFQDVDGDQGIFGTSEADILIGGSGSEVFIGEGGADRYIFNAGFGQDIIYVEDAVGQIIQFGEGISLADLRFEKDSLELIIHVGEADSVSIFDFFSQDDQTADRLDVFSHIEFASGEIFDLQTDIFTFRDIDGDGGVDGTTDSDIFIGGLENEGFFGGDGADLYIFDAEFGQDYILHETGTDNVIRFGEGISLEDLQFQREGDFLIIRVDESNSISVQDFFKVDPETGLDKGFGEIQFASGEVFDLVRDTLSLEGTDQSDSIEGTLDADILIGGRGADFLMGGEGRDTIFGGGQSDFISGDNGGDMLHGGAGSDTLLGGSGNDTLNGGDGFDRLEGGGNDDILRGGKGNDVLLGGHGQDALNGGAGNDSLNGGSGRDLLLGGGGNDKLSGARGQDILIGGRGDDTLSGGQFGDIFVFESGFGHDTITDFGNGGDSIDLSALGVSGISQLEIIQDGADTIITVGGDADNTITLQDTNADDINGGSFTFAPSIASASMMEDAGFGLEIWVADSVESLVPVHDTLDMDLTNSDEIGAAMALDSFNFFA